MSYAYVQDNTVQRVRSAVPRTWKLSTGQWISGFDVRPDLWLQEGWLPVVEVRPALGVDEQYGTPVYTVGLTEVTATYPVEPVPVEQINERTLRERAETALTANADFLAIASPTNAQVLAQVRVLTKECSALIRLAVSRLESTEGT